MQLTLLTMTALKGRAKLAEGFLLSQREIQMDLMELEMQVKIVKILEALINKEINNLIKVDMNVPEVMKFK